MSLFAGADKAEAGKTRFPRLGFGRHVIEIQEMSGFKYVDGTGSALVVDYTVVESGSPDDKPGEMRSHFQAIQKFSLGYIKLFAAACLGYKPSQKEEIEKDVAPIVVKTLDAACSPEQVFKGIRLVVQVTPKPDAKDPNKIHRNHTFYPLDAPAAA